VPDDVFKLPQSSYDTVCKVIISYTHIEKKTSLGEVSRIMGTDTTVISRNIAFLVAVGLLEGGRDKGITPVGARLGRALEFHQEDEIARTWREVLTDAPLVQRILSAIRVRGGMDAGTLQTQIVYTAGVSKTSGTTTGAAAVIEMLKAAGLIVEREGKFIAPVTAEQSDDRAEPTGPTSATPTITLDRAVPVFPASSGSHDVSVRVDVQIRVDATPDDLAVIGRNLRAMINELREQDADVDVDIEALSEES
jgi:hypothetical protein